MAKFLKNLSWFVLILLLILVIKTIFLKPNITNDIYAAKYNDYLTQSVDVEFNTLFFGSSRIYRQVDPVLFDSLGTSQNISSYNLGAPATFNPELYYIYERFLDDYNSGIVPDSIEYVFIELQRLNNLSAENALSDQGSYWNSIEYYWKSLNQIDDLQRRRIDKIDLIKNYSLSLLNNYISLYSRNKVSFEYFAQLNNGFLSLETELTINEDSSLAERRGELLRDKSKLIERKINLQNLSEEILYDGYLNESLNNIINELILSSKELGIKVYFIIPPKQSVGYYKELFPLKKANHENIIELASVNKYPKFYDLEYSFDIGHLNDRGVMLFTEKLFEEFYTLQRN